MNKKENSQVFYFGEGKEWFGTVTISQIWVQTLSRSAAKPGSFSYMTSGAGS
jgi:hypothetical protein